MQFSTLYTEPLSVGNWQTIAGFNCGDEPWSVDLNEFIKEAALAHQYKGLNRTWLFSDEAGECVGFVSLLASAAPVRSTGMTRRDLHYKEIPVLLIGRLAVAIQHRGQGIAPYLMAWTRRLARHLPIGCRFLALHVDRQNERAIRFYEKEGFIHTPPDYEPGSQMRLMLYNLVET